MTERVKATKRTSYIFKKTSRHQLSMSFSKLKEYEKLTQRYSEKSEEELQVVHEQVKELRKKMDEINYRTLSSQAPQTAVDLLAGMRRVDPQEDFLILASMSVTYHLYSISSPYLSQTITPVSWWFGTFRNVLSECVGTGRGYQKNRLGIDSYKVCVSAWEKAKVSEEYRSIHEYAEKEANFPVTTFTLELAKMLEESYQTVGTVMTQEDYDFTLISRSSSNNN